MGRCSFGTVGSRASTAFDDHPFAEPPSLSFSFYFTPLKRIESYVIAVPRYGKV